MKCWGIMPSVYGAIRREAEPERRRRRLEIPYRTSSMIFAVQGGTMQPSTGRLDEAERTELEAIDIAREAFGDDHYAGAITTSKLAGIVHDRGDHERAERLYREAVVRMRNHFADDHPSVMFTEARRARCLMDMGRHAEAETILLDGFRRFDESRGREDGYTQQVLEMLVGLYDKQGRTDDAAKYREMVAAP